MRKFNQPIGIFDSGVGGLTVFAQIEKILPYEDIIYFGDTARVPYGNKSKSTIIKFSIENILFLLKKKVKLVVVACNTVSSLALDYLKGTFSVPLLGVIEAGVNKALAETNKGRIGIIGTRATIESKSYERAIFKKNKNVQIHSKTCPLFVPIVEEGILNGKVAKEIVEMYLQELKGKNIDVLILGCTHYPLLKREISRYLEGVSIVDSAEEAALYTKKALDELILFNKNGKSGEKEFYVSDEPHSFVQLAKLFLQRNIPLPKVVQP